MNATNIIAGLVMLTALPLVAHAAASQADYQAAHHAAVEAHQKAGAMNNQWTTTADALDAAGQAADAGDYAKATRLAQRAEALAKRAIAQSRHQADNWQKAVVQ